MAVISNGWLAAAADKAATIPCFQAPIANDQSRMTNHDQEEHPMSRTAISTDQAPAAIGTYSQAIRVGNTVYLSGQIPLVPGKSELVGSDIRAQITQVFENLKAVAAAAGGSLNDVAKLNVFLTDLTHFPLVNEIMAGYFGQPYPARAAIGVAALPRGAAVEMDAIMVIGG